MAIFHSVFQDITQNWSQSQRENKEIKDNLRGIQGRLQHLKKLMEKVVREQFLFFLFYQFSHPENSLYSIRKHILYMLM